MLLGTAMVLFVRQVVDRRKVMRLSVTVPVRPVLVIYTTVFLRL